MQGVVFVKFQDFVEERWGVAEWKALLASAGFDRQTSYLRLSGYPDIYLQKLLLALSEKTGQAPNALLEEFGMSLGTYLVTTYAYMIDSQWNSIDILEHTNTHMQEIFRNLTGDQREGGDLSSVLHTHRLANDKVEIDYCSPRKMCALFVGIARAVAKWHGDTVTLLHRQCMHRGSPRCKIEAILEKAGSVRRD